MLQGGTAELRTPRLLLRRFVPEDLPAIYENCWSNFEVWKWTNYRRMTCPADVQREAGLFTDGWFAAYSRPDRYSWAIVLPERGEAVGRVSGLRPDRRLAQVELAYELGRGWWNRGLMTEAAGAAIGYLLRETGCRRVFAWHADQNPASGRVMQKCGMRCTGTEPRAGVCNAGVFDKVCYEILAEDGSSARSALPAEKA